MIVDTHAHICDPVFDADRAAVLERARAAGVTAVVAVAETLADARRNLEASQQVYAESLRKGFLTEGLWKHVRHPNFASEQAIWISFYLFSVTASGQWINFTLIGIS